MTISELRELLASGQFHHATVKVGRGSCWDGLFIYAVETATHYRHRGFKLVGSFPYGWGDTESPEMTEAYELVRHTGTSFGSYGQG